MNKEIFIKPITSVKSETGFSELQKDAIKRIQDMSGNIWTDYNEHDPGITILDILNYALTELDYKSSFPLQDYLNSNKKEFLAEDYGLYNPLQVYPTGPVTKADYRKLIFDRVPGLLDIWLIKTEGSYTGLYDILIEPEPELSDVDKEHLERRVINTFNSNRNICEDINTINVIDREGLELHGEIILSEDADASDILGKIYNECTTYFAPGIRYKPLKELFAQGVPWDEILNGPIITKGVIDDASVKPMRYKYYVSDLHRLIRGIDGVKAVKNISLRSGNRIFNDEITVRDPKRSYTVKIPLLKDNINLKLYKSTNIMSVKLNKVMKSYTEQRSVIYGKQNLTSDLRNMFRYDVGKYRNLEQYYSIQHDFPDFYGVNEMGVPPSAKNEDREERIAQAMQLKAYLLIFDLLLAGSVKELENAHQLLKVAPVLPNNKQPDLTEPIYLWDKLVDTEIYDVTDDYAIDFNTKQKHLLYNMLDAIYGEDSRQYMLKEFDVYSDDETFDLQRRAYFLKMLPKLGIEKAKGVNITNLNSGNMPGIKRWLSAMMGFGVKEEIPVTNVFTRYSIKLISDREFYEDMWGIMNIDFIFDKPFEGFVKSKDIFDVPMLDVEDPVKNYINFKESIYLLHHNILFESLLRNGTDIKRYAIIYVGNSEQYLLIYNAEERNERVNLGRFKSRAEAAKVANQFRRFLIMLNMQSETLYIVEHILLRSVKETDGYTLRINDRNEKQCFRLLNPVSRDNIYSIKEKLPATFADKTAFRTGVMKNGKYAILCTIDNNTLFCTNEFDDKISAQEYLQIYIDDHAEDIDNYSEICYKRDKNVILPEDFIDLEASIIFPSWSARLNNPKFRDWCEEILSEHIPAHLNIKVYWIDISLMRDFEKIYFEWREAVANGSKEQRDQQSVQMCIWLYKNRKYISGE
jgi:hypothetical protein